MHNIKDKDPFEKVIILISSIVLLGILGFASYKLITRWNSNDPISWYRVIDDDKYGIIGKNGDEIVPCIYKAVGSFEEGLAVVVDQSEKYGYVGIDGSIVIPCRYERAYDFNDGLGRICRNGKYYFINEKGETVIKTGYDYVYAFSDGVARIYQDGKYGFINKDGEQITPIVYEKAWDFQDGITAVIIDHDFYIIDKSGKRKTFERYSAFEFHDVSRTKGIWAKKKGKWGFIDLDEKTLLDFIYDEIMWVRDYDESGESTYSGGKSCVRVKINDKYGLFDVYGQCLIPPEYDKIEAYIGTGQYPSICVKGDKYGIVQAPGSFKYDYISPAGDNRYLVEEDELWGVIDDKGNIIIPIEYYGIEYDDVGVYVVDYENDKCGLLNELGERITTAVFDDVDDFVDGLAPACVNGKYGFIDKSGQTIIDYQFDKAECFSDGYAAVKLDGKYGYINKDGRAITGYKFDDVRDFNKGTAVVKINGRYWLLGASGELLTRRPYFDIGYENSTAFYNHLIPEYSNKYQDLMYDYVFNGMII